MTAHFNSDHLKLAVSICPDHGPYIANEHEHGTDGCPVQVDYDGITCGKVDKHPRTYVACDDQRLGREEDS
jgi:hypothetical protein